MSKITIRCEKPPFIKGNIFVTDINVKDYKTLKQLVKDKKSIYMYYHGTLHPAAVIMNWQYSLVETYMQSNYLFIAYNLSSYKDVSKNEPELFKETESNNDSNINVEIE